MNFLHNNYILNFKHGTPEKTIEYDNNLSPPWSTFAFMYKPFTHFTRFEFFFNTFIILVLKIIHISQFYNKQY